MQLHKAPYWRISSIEVLKIQSDLQSEGSKGILKVD